ncbi:hypothetical protein ACFL60_00115 [Candidatus Omnitrophota bacterium]
MNRLSFILLISATFVFIMPGFSQDEVEVNGIVESEEFLAVVNNEVVKEGDIIEGIEIIEIGKGYVKFDNGYRTFTKRLGQDVERRLEEKGLNLAHYNKAKKLYEKANSLEDKKALPFYKKALREAQWALTEIGGDKIKEMKRVVKDCRKRKSEINEKEKQLEAEMKKSEEIEEKPIGKKRRIRY